MLKEGLENSGLYQAKWASTGREAVEAVRKNKFDLVIVDMALTDVSPIALVQAIRKMQNGVRVMMIPLMGQDLPQAAQALNINGILTKPFFVGDLPDIVDEAMDRPRRQRPAVPSPPPAEPEEEEEVEEPPAEISPPETSRIAALRTAAVPQQTISYLRANESEILRLLNDLNREVRAEAILLIAGEELIAQAGMLSREQSTELSLLVAQSSQAAAQAASFLGEQAGRFAQSLHEGAEYRLYTLTLSEGILLSLALSSNVPLGMIRHQCRQIAAQLTRFIT